MGFNIELLQDGSIRETNVFEAAGEKITKEKIYNPDEALSRISSEIAALDARIAQQTAAKAELIAQRTQIFNLIGGK